jgi:hypothetical protein
MLPPINALPITSDKSSRIKLRIESPMRAADATLRGESLEKEGSLKLLGRSIQTELAPDGHG